MSRSWFSIQNKSEAVAEIILYDEIGLFGITAKDFITSLRSVGDRKILLRINSPGGSVFDGSAIYSRLRDHAGGVEVRIDGIAASIASVIAMAGDKIIMPENAMMMIHNPSGVVMGDSDDMRQLADLLDKIKGTLITAYARKTGKDTKELSKMLDEETWFTAQEAIEHGFADELAEPLALAATLRPDQLARFSKVPSSLRATTPAALTPTQRNMTAKTPEEIAAEEKAAADAAAAQAAEEKAAADAKAKEEADKKAADEAADAASATPADEEVKAVLGRVTALNTDLLTARCRITELEALLAARDTKVADLTSQVTALSKTSTLYADLKKSLGIAPAATVPETVINNGELNPEGSADSDEALMAKYEKATPEEQQKMMAHKPTRLRLMANTSRNLK
jgi:ATP-dependent Clp endopeptidase proteolytic subunit ClpP